MNQRFVRMTFYFTYVMLITTGTICFIEAISNKDPSIRHIMNLEVCISVVAAYFYGQFLEKLSKSEDTIDYPEINLTRYTDWFVTTPLMLLVLCLVLVYNNKSSLSFAMFLVIVMLNFAMLASGYMGETQKVDKNVALSIGFIFFFMLYALIFILFVQPNPSFDNIIIFGAFFVLWSVYGIAYKMDEETKNVAFNILDLLAKAIVGIFFWMYLTKVVVL
jgi:bacteriorhodopsin